MMDDNLTPEGIEEQEGTVDTTDITSDSGIAETSSTGEDSGVTSLDDLFEEEDTEASEEAPQELPDSSEEKLSIDDVVEKDGGEEIEEVPVIKKKKSDKKWYSLRVISGKEKKIKERIELEVQRNKWSSVVTQVLVPSEKVYKIRAGKKVILERNILPGYILIEAVSKSLRGEMITAIANIPNVIHFLGRNHPIPMHQSEANRMLGKVDESQDASAAMIEPFIVGETVKIMDGPFKDFVGDIKDVNEEKKKLKVIVKIFGRGTEVELNFMQVEKQS